MTAILAGFVGGIFGAAAAAWLVMREMVRLLKRDIETGICPVCKRPLDNGCHD